MNRDLLRIVSTTLLISMVTFTTESWALLPFEESPEYHLEMGKSIESMQTLDVNAVKSAYDEFVKVASYDKSKYAPIMEELLNIGNSGDQELKIKLSRQILLSNPLLDCDKILVTKYNLGAGAASAMAPQIGTALNNWSNLSRTKRNGFDAEIIIMSNLRGDEIKFDRVYKPQNSTAISDVLLHWDGEKILFSAVDDQKLWNIFEVKSDGTGLKKMINCPEPDLDFFDATYLPDGNIIAASNIGYQGVPCVHGASHVSNFVTYNPETEKLRRLTFDQDANWHPRVMNNGKLMYTRWEYTDLLHYFSRYVMHANPDGTETKALYGSGGWFPNGVLDMEAIPGGNSTFIGIITGHHGVAHAGRLILFDPIKGRKEIPGMIQEIPFSKREIKPLVKDRLVDNVWPLFVKPWPLSDKFFLVSAKMTPTSPWSIYLVDIYDNVTLIARDENGGFISPILLQERETPPVIPNRVDESSKESTLFIQDIYEGEGLPNVPRGTVKKLRIFAYEFAYPLSRSNRLAQGVQSGWDMKRVIGEVDVEEDGSAMFKVPANTPISIQPLDANGCAIQWMRSWLTGMPGEIVSCIGCHEDQNSMPLPKRVKASLSDPKDLTIDEGGIRSFTYNLEIQPILDRACIACHNENSKLNFKREDLIEEIEDISYKKHMSTIAGDNGEVYYTNKSYLNLHPYVNRQGSEGDIVVLAPYEYHASTSELIKILRRGHHGVELMDEEWKKFTTWIDLNAPMHGRFVYNEQLANCPTNAYDRRIELTNKYANNTAVDWKREIDDYAEFIAAKGEIKAVKPEVVEPKYKSAKAKGFPFSEEEAKAMIASAKSRKIVEIADGVKIEFVRIPAGTFVMGDNTKGQNNNKPESKVKIDKPFWMATTELTNEQYGVICPEHNSRYISRFWADRTHLGTPANLPNQPVVRVTWNNAMAYCEKLSTKCGEKFRLPTEAQWEWACRAGSATPMWYGEVGVDYSKYENLGDSELAKMAAEGYNDTPISPNSRAYALYAYLPRDKKVTDNSIVASEVGQYAPNPWGLYDMHGNVGELTRSNYAAYPYNDRAAESDLKVYRGGSWLTRAKMGAAYSRNEIYIGQPSYTVGFRLIIEE